MDLCKMEQMNDDLKSLTGQIFYTLPSRFTFKKNEQRSSLCNKNCFFENLAKFPRHTQR